MFGAAEEDARTRLLQRVAGRDIGGAASLLQATAAWQGLEDQLYHVLMLVAGGTSPPRAGIDEAGTRIAATVARLSAVLNRDGSAKAGTPSGQAMLDARLDLARDVARIVADIYQGTAQSRKHFFFEKKNQKTFDLGSTLVRTVENQ